MMQCVINALPFFNLAICFWLIYISWKLRKQHRAYQEAIETCVKEAKRYEDLCNEVQNYTNIKLNKPKAE